MCKFFKNTCIIIGIQFNDSVNCLNFQDRLKGLRAEFPELEILVVEQGLESRLVPEAGLEIRYDFYQAENGFNRGLSFNQGALKTNREYLIFGKEPNLPEREVVEKWLADLEEFDAVIPIASKGHFETTTGRNEHWESGYSFSGEAISCCPWIFLTRCGFYRIVGWNEKLKSFCAQERAFLHIVYEVLKTKTVSIPVLQQGEMALGLKKGFAEVSNDQFEVVQEIGLLTGPALKRHLLWRSIVPPNRPKFILAITTFNRLKYLKNCVSAYLKTRSPNYEWQVIIADDGSTDGTLDYLEELEKEEGFLVIRNDRVKIHRQVNSILRELSGRDFDLCFRCDDDIIFLEKGWDHIYWKAVRETGFDHLVYYDPKWKPQNNLTSPRNYNSVANLCDPIHLQGAFYTLTPEVIDRVGYFDINRFGVSGLGHIDYSFRCCRAGFNRIDQPLDAKNSHQYLRLQNPKEYQPSTPIRSKVGNETTTQQKWDCIFTPRIFIPYNDSEVGVQVEELEPQPTSFPKADSSFYPNRGISGFLGFLIKRVYNLSLDLRLFFIPKMIKRLGGWIHQRGIDLIHIDQ